MSNRPITLALASPGLAQAADTVRRSSASSRTSWRCSKRSCRLAPTSRPTRCAPGCKQSRERLRASDSPDDMSSAGLRLSATRPTPMPGCRDTSSAREAEFTGVIRLLRELSDGLRGDAVAFRDDLRRSSDRVADLTQIEDIRTLRRALNREVDQLRQCVQQGERQEASRLAQVAGDLKKVDATIAQTTRTPASPTRACSGARHCSAIWRPSPHAPASIVICRIDDPEAIVDGHGAAVLERVIIALAQLLKGTFGKETRVYRSSTQCVAMFLPRALPKQVAQQVKNVQARVAPEYEYERNGVTRRVVFTFSGVITSSQGGRAERRRRGADPGGTQAEALPGLSQLQTESSGLGRLVGWLSSAG